MTNSPVAVAVAPAVARVILLGEDLLRVSGSPWAAPSSLAAPDRALRAGAGECSAAARFSFSALSSAAMLVVTSSSMSESAESPDALSSLLYWLLALLSGSLSKAKRKVFILDSVSFGSGSHCSGCGSKLFGLQDPDPVLNLLILDPDSEPAPAPDPDPQLSHTKLNYALTLYCHLTNSSYVVHTT